MVMMGTTIVFREIKFIPKKDVLNTSDFSVIKKGKSLGKVVGENKARHRKRKQKKGVYIFI